VSGRVLSTVQDLIFYVPLRAGIEVVRVLHGARDLAQDDFS
jgi:plasmid stabilization system protein ParE